MNWILLRSPDHFLEVKRSACSPLEFSWFSRQFPGKTLTVISSSEFKAGAVQGISLENFLSKVVP